MRQIALNDNLSDDEKVINPKSQTIFLNENFSNISTSNLSLSETSMQKL